MKEETIVIEGGRQLAGDIEISGAKNAALPCLFASLLSSDKVVLDNLPLVTDIKTSIEVLKSLGLAVRRKGRQLSVDARKADRAPCEVPLAQARAMRASILALGPLLAQRGEAVVPLPGGCDFGSRPIDIHLRGLRKMGADIEMKGGVLHARASRLRGQRLTLEFPSFTGTENLMMAACLAQGETVIDNAAREPEIADLAALLGAMGARIEGAGTSRISVDGVASLGGASHAVMPDRIEAGTYLAATAAAHGDLHLHGCGGDELAVVLDKLEDAGAEIESGHDRLGIIMDRRPKAVDITTAPYPGFPTDLQAQFLALSSIADGTGRIVEGIWETALPHRRRAAPHGRRHRRQRQLRDRQRRPAPDRCPCPGQRPARLRRPRHRRPLRQRHDRDPQRAPPAARLRRPRRQAERPSAPALA